ncbi:hypothetical protein [Thermodesulfovibrio yellowstonii]|nr:hypothetical protein [Thermodesulfovibrio islandicus]
MSLFRRLFRSVSRKVFNYIENNGNVIFEKNGEKVFVENLFKTFKANGEKKIVFDIGANIGEYSKMLLQNSQRYNVELNLHLFEPTKSCFEILSQKFGSYKNVFINNFGVSDSNTIAKIFYDKEQSGLASLYQRNLDSYNIRLNKS